VVKSILIVFMLLTHIVGNDDLSAYRSLKSLENTLESQIRNEIRLYTTSPFNVSVSVILDEIQTTTESSKKKSLPGVYQPSDNQSKENDKLLKNELNHIEVVITLDTGVDPSIISLAKKIAYEKANLSDRRGDKVTVIKKALQLKKKKLEVSDDVLDKIQQLDEQLADLGAMSEQEVQNIEEKFQNSLDLVRNESQLAIQKNSDVIEAVKENSFYWVLFVVVAFVIFAYLVFLYLSSVFKKQREHVNGLELKLQQDLDAVKSYMQETIDEMETKRAPDVDQRLITDLSTLVIARKGAVKTFIKSELRTTEGQEKVALLAQVLGTKSIAALLFKDETVMNEVLEVSGKFQFNSDRRESLTTDLYKDLLEKTNDQNNQDFDEFAFVKNMDIDQILLLLEGEDNGIQAFILTQIDKVMSAQVLNRLDDNLKLTLLVELSNMRPMDAQTYSALSKKLSLKISAFPKINHFVVDGEAEMASQILYLRPKDQTAMLNKILTQDANLYKRIKENYLFAEDVENMSDDILKVLLLTLDDTNVALVLYQFTQEVKGKLLTKVNERKMVILDEKVKAFEESTPSVEKMSVALYEFLTEANLLREKSA